MNDIFISHKTDLIGPVRIEKFRLHDGYFFDMVYDYMTGRHMISELFDDCGELVDTNYDDGDEYIALLEEEAAIMMAK